jgi:hypothetical protein
MSLAAIIRLHHIGILKLCGFSNHRIGSSLQAHMESGAWTIITFCLSCLDLRNYEATNTSDQKQSTIQKSLRNIHNIICILPA